MRDSNKPSKTILFSGHDLRFIRPFVAWCEGQPRYRVLVDQHQGHEITQPDRCRELLHAADIIFCEWCLGNAEWYSHHKLPHQTLVVRLHLQELRLSYLDRVKWDNVDALVLICPRNLEVIRERYPFLREKARLIFNPIDTAALNQPKLTGAEFNLGLMGICPMRKAPHLAWELLLRLKKVDSRYTLFFKGKPPHEYDWLWQRAEERAYYDGLYSNIEHSGHAHSIVFETYGEDVPLWFSKIGFILSTSDFEGSHQAVAEGMASGAIPVIRSWKGADQIYPPKYTVSTVEQAAAAILKWRTPGVYEDEMEFCRGYAQGHFDQTEICNQFEALFDDLARPAHTDSVCAPHPGPAETMVPPALFLGYLPVGFRGGYRIRIEQEIKALVRLGCGVHFACLHPDRGGAAELTAHRAELERLGCQVHLVPITRFFDVNLSASLVREALDALQEIIARHGLAILHAEALYCARIGLLLKQRCPDLRLVFDCHGASPEEERMSGAHPSRVSAMEEWERRILAGADLNVFVSQAMRNFYLGRYGFAELPHVIVPCCVTDERFPEEDAPCALPLPAERPILAYVGTMAAWQCGEEMIRLFGQLHRQDPQVFFLLAVPRADHAKVREWMTQYRLAEDTVLLTELAHEQVAPALGRSHAGVLLRRNHPVNQVSSPTKFAEYLAAGLPVLLTNGIGDFSNLAVTRQVGLLLDADLLDFDTCSPRDISHILAFLYASKQRRQQVAARCRGAAREYLHWETRAPALAKGYLDIEHKEARIQAYGIRRRFDRSTQQRVRE